MACPMCNGRTRSVWDSDLRRYIRYCDRCGWTSAKRSGGKVRMEKPTKTETKQIEQRYVEKIKAELKQHKRVLIPGIGVLRTQMRKARKSRMGRNPATGERMRIKAQKAKKVVKFRAAKQLKEAVRRW